MATQWDKVYPSEYTYHSDSVHRSERDSPNRRRYSATFRRESSIHPWPEDYTHFDGTTPTTTTTTLGDSKVQTTKPQVRTTYTTEKVTGPYPQTITDVVKLSPSESDPESFTRTEIMFLVIVIAISTFLLIASLIIIILVIIRLVYWRKKISRANTQQRASEYEMEGNPASTVQHTASADGDSETMIQNIYANVH